MMATIYRKLGYMFAMGSEIGILVGGGSALGYWLDGRYHSSPWLFLACLLVGLVGAARRTYDYTKRLTQSEEDDDLKS
jgi:F0F1-type ATP synthase assembly protein I